MVMKIFLEGSWREISEINSADKAVLDVTAGTGSRNPGTHSMITDDNISKLTFEVEEGGSLSDFFSGTSNLTRFDGSLHDFSEATSAQGMFYDSNIVEVSNITDLVKVTNMSSMFGSASSLELVKNLKIYNNANLGRQSTSMFHSGNPNLKLENVDVENTTTLSYMFASTNKRTLVEGEIINTHNITNMSNMFFYSNFREIGVNALDTQNVTNMGSMFENTSLTGFDGNYLNTEKVTNMRAMFNGNNSLELVKNLKIYNNASLGTSVLDSLFGSGNPNLKLENVDVENTTNLSYMFGSSNKRTLVEGEIINTHNITDMSNMFYSSSIRVIGVNALDTQNVTNMASMFDNSSLTGFDGNYLNTEKVTNMSSMFGRTNSLELVKNLKICNNASLGTSTLNPMFSGGNPDLKLENVDVENTTHLRYMFANTNKRTLVDGEIINTHNITDMSSMFYYASIREIHLSMINVNNIRDAFYRTNSLSSLILEGMGGALQTTARDRTINVADTAMDGDALNAMAESLADTNNVTPWIIEYNNTTVWDTSIATNKGYIVRAV